METALKHVISIVVAAALACLFAATVLAADPYKENRRQALETYKMDKESCLAVKGAERKTCMRIAKEKYAQELAEVKKDQAKK